MQYCGIRSREQILEDFVCFMGQTRMQMLQMAGLDIIPGRREGAVFWDISGKEYINCHCNGGVYNLGHRHPEIVETLRSAMEELDFGVHHFISEHRTRLAAKLADLTPGDIQYTTFSVGGGEAVDLALKVARYVSGRAGVLYAGGGYHGVTGLAMCAGNDEYKEAFHPLTPGFLEVPFGDFQALDALVGDSVGTIILETIPATLGIVMPPEDYFPRIRALCDKKEIVLIVDEVQAGLGRTGRMWAIDEYRVVPDILVVSKGMSGGLYPLAVTCHRPALQAVFETHPFFHVSTFGGSELGCVVTEKMLEITTRPGFLDHVNAMADRFHSGFSSLLDTFRSHVKEFRHKGLMMGLQLQGEEWGLLLSQCLAEKGVWAIFANNDKSVVQFLPPLVIQPEQVDAVLERVNEALKALIKRV
jgi:acetylornithine/succinyldiaminopimelate/putrescine aminotransferase